MAARTFRYRLENTIRGHTLVLASHSLCGGCWTKGWRPPATIDSGVTVGWQSESCGVMTGTQGWVKYRIRRSSDGAHRGLLYAYWTNPYLGVTYGKWALVGQDTTADCDEDVRGAGSSFADSTGENRPPSDIHLAPTGVRKNGSPTSVDEWKDLLHVPIAPFVIFGTMGIWERMEIDLRLSTTSSPTLLPDPGPRTTSVETKPRITSFVGDWSGRDVRVSLALTGFRQFRVRVTDRSRTAAPLELDVTASLGLATWTRMLEESVAGPLLTGQSEDRDAVVQRSVALAALTTNLRLSEDRPPGAPEWFVEGAPAARRIETEPLTRSALTERALKQGLSPSKHLDDVASIVATTARAADHIIHVGNGIALFLVRIEEAGRFAGYRLRYQRVATDGALLVDQDLDYVINLH